MLETAKLLSLCLNTDDFAQQRYREIVRRCCENIFDVKVQSIVLSRKVINTSVKALLQMLLEVYSCCCCRNTFDLKLQNMRDND